MVTIRGEMETRAWYYSPTYTGGFIEKRLESLDG